MLLAPKRGFVLLTPPKTASTAIEGAFRRYAEVSLQRNPFKHTNYAQFQHFLEPWLGSTGYLRDSYEVICVVREPIDWLNSWWRYRSREELARPSHPQHYRYVGHLSFEQFARAYMGSHTGERSDKGDKKFPRMGRPTRFLEPLPGEPEVDRVFRYERLDLLVGYLREKVGVEVEVGLRNVSPKRSFSLSEECERELRRFFTPEYELYERAVGG
jgi:hypothetical protein